MAEILRRVEIPFDGTAVIGAQKTVEVGFENGGVWYKQREETTGLNAGDHPQYDETLADVLGEALVEALKSNERAATSIADLTRQVDERDVWIGQAERMLAAAATRIEKLEGLVSQAQGTGVGGGV